MGRHGFPGGKAMTSGPPSRCSRRKEPAAPALRNKREKR
ncbi:hypothetical protein RHECNPAF_12600112 [Rhizobium etli CNPAF512]|nr:hypothetical protein RHECNPAF_12600112 [Rhizobium etli CNPAF512]